MRALVLSTAAFLTNRRGYPTLSKAHQQLLAGFWRQGVQVPAEPCSFGCHVVNIFGDLGFFHTYLAVTLRVPFAWVCGCQQLFYACHTPSAFVLFLLVAAGQYKMMPDFSTHWHPLQQHLRTRGLPAMQVILSDPTSLAGSRPAAAAGDGTGPSTSEGAQPHSNGSAAAATASAHGGSSSSGQPPPPEQHAPIQAELHRLRPYCEYLSFLFRKPEGPVGQEEMELGYRDYLQVRAAVLFRRPTADASPYMWALQPVSAGGNLTSAGC